MKLVIPLLLLLASSLAVESNDFVFSLILVNSGSTSPEDPIPEETWEKWYEHGPKELTAMGMREQYLLGYELRRRYNTSLDADSLMNQLYVRMVDRNSTIMSGQAFLRGFLRNNIETLNEAELKKADPPIVVEKYFKEKIGNKVLPSGISTFPFHTYYPRNQDVLDPSYCKNATSKNFLSLSNNEKVKKSREVYEKNFKTLLNEKYHEVADFPHYVHFLESIETAIYQYKETSLPKDTENWIHKFAEDLYFPKRIGDPTAVKHQTTRALQFLLDFIKSNMETNVKDIKRKQNRRIAFLFIEDIMMTNILAMLNWTKVDKILPPASIIAFDVTKVSSPEVNVKLNDFPVWDLSTFSNFESRMKKSILNISEDKLQSYCNSN